MEILRIKTKNKSPEFLQVLQDFKKHISTNKPAKRAPLTCFMNGMFYYDRADWRYITCKEFHGLAVENRLNLGIYEYIFVEFAET